MSIINYIEKPAILVFSYFFIQTLHGNEKIKKHSIKNYPQNKRVEIDE